jgi:hypothetical protein
MDESFSVVVDTIPFNVDPKYKDLVRKMRQEGRSEKAILLHIQNLEEQRIEEWVEGHSLPDGIVAMEDILYSKESQNQNLPPGQADLNYLDRIERRIESWKKRFL